MNKTFSILFSISLFVGVILIAFIFFIFKKYSANLPSYEQLKDYNPMITTRLYAADGSLLSEFSKENRIFVPIQNIPNNLINAFLAAEDSNFYHHSGIDPFAILRTAIKNLIAKMQGSHSMGGASTITQQVVKNMLLTNDRTIQRKIKEAILAIRMTQSFSKDHILELYLNQIYLGSGAYGVAAAAQAYFNKSIDSLSIEEEALLATLPKAPSKLDPRKNLTKAKIRRDWVIRRMIEEEFITEEEGLKAIAQPIFLSDNNNDENTTRAAFFSDSVKKELTALYGADHVFEDGIVVRTTIDPNLQKIAAKSFQKGLEKYDMKHGYRGPIARIIRLDKDKWLEQLSNVGIKELYKNNWQKAVILSRSKYSAKIGLENGENGIIKIDSLAWAKRYINVNETGEPPQRISDVFREGDVILVEEDVTQLEETPQLESEEPTLKNYVLRQIPQVNGAFLAMDPHTGRVLAMMGGYIDAPNQFNRSTQAMRQPGSTMKTFGYIAALENEMTPATLIMDEEVSLDQGEGLPPYKPTNYSNKFYGPTTLRTGLEKSRNVTTVRMADQIGLEKVMEVVKRFDINKKPKNIYSLVLGSTETSVLRLARAYAMMVNGGKKIKPAMIEKIQNRNGLTIYRRDNRKCNNCIIKEGTPNNEIPKLRAISQNITDSATAYQITSMLQGVVKNGTARRAQAVGKIIGGKTGTTNNSFDSWFVGFSPDLVAAVYVGFDNPRTLGSYESGSSIALPIFVDFMKEALKDKPSTPFRVPNNVKFVKIDRSDGTLATTETDKKDIFFEAFKLDDVIEQKNTPSNDNSEFNSGFESEVEGIY